MVVVGIAFIVFWALFSVFVLSVATAAVVTGVGFVLLGLLLGERPFNRN